MQGVNLQVISPIVQSQSGETLELFKGLLGRQVTFYRRNKNAVFGNHFHKGIDSSKNSEYFFVISGEIEATFYNGLSGEKETRRIGPRSLLVIDKNVYHSFVGLTDVEFIEYRSQVFDPDADDCWPLEQYEAYITALKKSWERDVTGFFRLLQQSKVGWWLK